MSKHIEIEIEEVARTELAVLVTDGKVEEWIPLSMISDYTEDEHEKYTSIFIAESLAFEKGLI